jgi:O-antigen/teichoic acid export membrane protein
VVQINSLLAIFLNTVERVIAIPLCGLAAAGLLDISTRLPYMALSVPGAFVGAALPSISDVQGREASGELKQDLVRHVYLTCTRYMNAISGTLLGFMAVVAAPALAFWLKSVPDGAPLLMIAFSICSQFHLMTGPGTSMVKGIGKPRMEFHYSLANLVALCFTVLLSRMFFGGWSATSVGVGVAAATIVSAIYFISTANRCLHIRGVDFMRHSVFPGVLPYAAAFLSGIPMRLIAMPQGRILLGCWLGCRFAICMMIVALLWWMLSATAAEKAAVLKRVWWHRQPLPAQA